MRHNGYEVNYIPARLINDRPVIKYTDRTMDIAVDIIRMIDRLDIVIIGSCNLNLVPLFIYLKEKGIKIIIFACNIPRKLIMVCDEWWEITEDLLEVNESIKNDTINKNDTISKNDINTQIKIKENETSNTV